MSEKFPASPITKSADVEQIKLTRESEKIERWMMSLLASLPVDKKVEATVQKTFSKSRL